LTEVCCRCRDKPALCGVDVCGECGLLELVGILTVWPPLAGATTIPGSLGAIGQGCRVVGGGEARE
jgi:hypothetical protein